MGLGILMVREVDWWGNGEGVYHYGLSGGDILWQEIVLLFCLFVPCLVGSFGVIVDWCSRSSVYDYQD